MCLNLWYVWEQFVLLVLLCTNFQYLVLINNLQNILYYLWYTHGRLFVLFCVQNILAMHAFDC
jgi:hypothetical protein